MKFDGATVSSNWRAPKVTIASCRWLDAAHAGGGGFPPVLDREKAVRVDIEREGPPFRRAEAVVVGQRAAARIIGLAGEARGRVGGMVGDGAGRLRRERSLLAGRDQQMRRPIEVGADERAWCEPHRDAAKGGVKLAVEGLQRVEGFSTARALGRKALVGNPGSWRTLQVGRSAFGAAAGTGCLGG